MVSFLDWDDLYTEVRTIVEQVDGLVLVTDTGDVAEYEAPCGCNIYDACAHPGSVTVCETHGATYHGPMPDFSDDGWDEYFTFDKAYPSWWGKRRTQVALAQLMA